MSDTIYETIADEWDKGVLSELEGVDPKTMESHREAFFLGAAFVLNRIGEDPVNFRTLNQEIQAWRKETMDDEEKS